MHASGYAQRNMLRIGSFKGFQNQMYSYQALGKCYICISKDLPIFNIQAAIKPLMVSYSASACAHIYCPPVASQASGSHLVIPVTSTSGP